MTDQPKYDNLSIGQVAELLGMQRRGVRKLARRLGIPAAPNWGAPTFTAEQIERMQSAPGRGCGLKELNKERKKRKSENRD
jgi:hypothetical protein